MAYHYTPLGKQVGLRRYVPPFLAIFVFLSGLLFIAHSSGVSITGGGSGLRNLPDPGSRVASNSLLPAAGPYHDLAYVPEPHDEITEERKGWKWYNDAKLRALTACQARGDCHPNAAKVSRRTAQTHTAPRPRLPCSHARLPSSTCGTARWRCSATTRVERALGE